MCPAGVREGGRWQGGAVCVLLPAFVRGGRGGGRTACGPCPALNTHKLSLGVRPVRGGASAVVERDFFATRRDAPRPSVMSSTSRSIVNWGSGDGEEGKGGERELKELREGKAREGKGRKGKAREGKAREGKGGEGRRGRRGSEGKGREGKGGAREGRGRGGRDGRRRRGRLTATKAQDHYHHLA